ncbi:MAG: helix-turn-helix transcriptional regulator [Clostridia bacterium]|nr:helix-turn-helix transcriptional regulator [Clostridia bacterium]
MQPIFGLKREQQNQLYLSHFKRLGGMLHFHSQIELLLLEKGEAEVWINDQRRVLRAGEMAVALSYDAHAYKSVGEASGILLFIPTHLCEEFISAVKSKRATSPFISAPDAIAEIRACLDRIERGGTNRIKLTGYIYELLGILMEHVDLKTAQEPMDPRLSSKLLFYINENYKKEISLAGIAAAFGYNPSYLSRYFKSCFHIGINRYITILRLKNAIMLLREGNYGITYCALESGFGSMRTFYRCFGEEFACSPKEYLEQLRGETEAR